MKMLKTLTPLLACRFMPKGRLRLSIRISAEAVMSIVNSNTAQDRTLLVALRVGGEVVKVETEK